MLGAISCPGLSPLYLPHRAHCTTRRMIAPCWFIIMAYWLHISAISAQYWRFGPRCRGVTGSFRGESATLPEALVSRASPRAHACWRLNDERNCPSASRSMRGVAYAPWSKPTQVSAFNCARCASYRPVGCGVRRGFAAIGRPDAHVGRLARRSDAMRAAPLHAHCDGDGDGDGDAQAMRQQGAQAQIVAYQRRKTHQGRPNCRCRPGRRHRRCRPGLSGSACPSGTHAYVIASAVMALAAVACCRQWSSNRRRRPASTCHTQREPPCPLCALRRGSRGAPAVGSPRSCPPAPSVWGGAHGLRK